MNNENNRKDSSENSLKDRLKKKLKKLGRIKLNDWLWKLIRFKKKKKIYNKSNFIIIIRDKND